MPFKKNTFIFCFAIAALILSGQIADAQKIELKDVVKIQLTTAGSFTSDYYRQVEIVPKENGWSCYQTRLAEARFDREAWKTNKKFIVKQIRDSTRHFVKTVLSATLDELITHIYRTDTVLDLKQFPISKAYLKQQADSMYDVHLTAAQKIDFKNIVESKPAAVKEALLNVLNPTPMDDRTDRLIVFTRKNGKTDTLEAYSNTELYYLPWTFNGQKKYDPRIAELFESIGGKDGWAAKERENVHRNIAMALYHKFLEGKIAWEDYKQKQPLDYASVNTTLTPSLFYTRGRSGFLKSSLLPSNLEISFGFRVDSTFDPRYNAYETALVNVYKNGSFLFDYLKQHPSYVARFFPFKFDLKGFNQVKAIYPTIEKYDYKQIDWLYITENYYKPRTFSHWLLLPDGTAILLRYNNKFNVSGKSDFSGFTEKNSLDTHWVCIVFDKKGHRIVGSDNEVKIDSGN